MTKSLGKPPQTNLTYVRMWVLLPSLIMIQALHNPPRMNLSSSCDPTEMVPRIFPVDYI